jgi:hypothetical protein
VNQLTVALGLNVLKSGVRFNLIRDTVDLLLLTESPVGLNLKSELGNAFT